MTVISDTSPITNLLQIGQLTLLQKLFGQIILPEAVYDELCVIPAQKAVIDNQNWLLVQKASDDKLVALLKRELDQGEAEAIALTIELKADMLIIDELKGRSKAEQLGLRFIGLLGALIEGKQRGLIAEIKPLLEDLMIGAGFRLHPKLFQQVLKLAGEN